jgi:hypothetical protein
MRSVWKKAILYYYLKKGNIILFSWNLLCWCNVLRWIRCLCDVTLSVYPLYIYMARHIFQACPVWIYTQSNITQALYYLLLFCIGNCTDTLKHIYTDIGLNDDRLKRSVTCIKMIEKRRNVQRLTLQKCLNRNSCFQIYFDL